MFFILTLIPSSANAEIFSSISGFLGHKSVEAAETTENSQVMSILEAPLNIDPIILSKEMDVMVVDVTALDSETGPSGSSADVLEARIPGQILVYTVKKEDNVNMIAKMFDVSVNTILWANSLPKNTVLKEGQNLIILPITGIKYVVKKGDTLSGLITKYKADIDEVLAYNDLAINTVLKAGQEIILPDVDIAEPVTVSNNTKASRYLGGSGPYYPNYYMFPLRDSYRKTQGLHGWNAFDFAAPLGTPIYASASGVAIIASGNGLWNKGYGNYVVISHPNGTQTLYGHASKVLVSSGQSISKGDLIALMGSTGKSTGSHLHFEVRGAKNPF